MPNPVDDTNKSIVYFVTEDWYFCSHRFALALAAQKSGFAVHVITRVTTHGDTIRSAGFDLIPISLSRGSVNPIAAVVAIVNLVRIYRCIKPSIVHHVSMKPVILGSIAARFAKVPSVVNALTGLGFLFSSSSIVARLLRPTIKGLLRVLLNNGRTTVIVQNPDDAEMMVEKCSLNKDRVCMIFGSGVDTREYEYIPEPAGVPVVLMASRLLWDKGVGEFVEAARHLKGDGLNARFVLVGDRDDENPESVSTNQLKVWSDEGIVELWGRRSDMPSVLSMAHIVCLPSYREGLPKVLIEAASCGRPIVTTDAPGCRETVIDGSNGILVPVKDVNALAHAIRTLVSSPEMRAKMGRSGRQLAKNKLSLDLVIRQTLDVYSSIRY